jgi:hypothetical protein
VTPPEALIKLTPNAGAGMLAVMDTITTAYLAPLHDCHG